MLFLGIISNHNSIKEKQEASEVEKKKKDSIPFEMILLILCSSKYQFIQQ